MRYEINLKNSNLFVKLKKLSSNLVGVQNKCMHVHRGLAVMRPACHLDTQNTVFWQFGHPKVYVRIC